MYRYSAADKERAKQLAAAGVVGAVHVECSRP